ncbi:DUF6318 family protein [Cellulomonas sp. P5_E12]
MSWLTSSRRGARLVAPVTGLLLLAACTGGTPEATESSTPAVVVTPSPTPTSTPTESPKVDVSVKPSRPAALDEPPSADGAVAAAEYFLGLYPYIYATGDLNDWNALSHPECVFCSSATTNAQAMAGRGEHSQGGAFELVDRSVLEVNPGAWYTVKIDLIQDPSATLNGTGDVVKSFPDTKRIHVDLAVVWNNGSWAVREATPTEEPSS